MAHSVIMPQFGLTMEEGTVETWLKQEGDKIEVGDELLEVSTDKLVNVLESEFEGTLLKIVAEEGEDVLVKGVLAIIGEEGENIDHLISGSEIEDVEEEAKEIESQDITEESKSSPDTFVDSGDGSAARTSTGRIKISPLAKKTAEKMNVDYSNIQGSGPGGRIRQEDILQAPESSTTQATAEVAVEKAPVDIHLEDGDVIEKISGMRKVIAERMTQSAQEIPTVTQDVEVRMNKLMEFRKQINEDREERISVNDFIIKAVAKALISFPMINSNYIDGQIVKRANVNMGVAVSTDGGLIVPVVKKANLKSLSSISEEVKDLSLRAREGGLQSDEYSGSSFTISNLGMFNVTSFTPIINQPDVAILGVNTIKEELALDDEGNVYKEKIMTLSLTFDHRVVDGAEAAQFENEIVKLLENPINIIL